MEAPLERGGGEGSLWRARSAMHLIILDSTRFRNALNAFSHALDALSCACWGLVGAPLAGRPARAWGGNSRRDSAASRAPYHGQPPCTEVASLLSRAAPLSGSCVSFIMGSPPVRKLRTFYHSQGGLGFATRETGRGVGGATGGEGRRGEGGGARGRGVGGCQRLGEPGD